MKATQIHPKVAASGTAGVVVQAVAAILIAFGVAVPAAALGPITLLVMLAAGYLKASGRLDALGS